MAKSKSFGSQKASDPHLTAGKGGLPGQVDDLRKDVEAGFTANEARTGFPVVDWVDGVPPAAAGGSAVLRGRNLLQSQTFDSLVVTDSAEGALGSVTITALKPGDSGISVVVATPTGSLALAYNAGTKVLTITPTATTGDTDDAIATAINADNSPVRGILRAASAGAGSILHAIASAPLTGGEGEYAGNAVTISGVEALPANTTGTAGAAAWADTVVTVTVPDLTAASPARATGDTVSLVLSSDGVMSVPIYLVLGGGGIVGPTGSAGPTGATGPTGPTGPTGV